MTETVDTVVIGAGVVGLSCARALALAGRDVIILEAADAIGTGISARNSEVIHAGIYYPAGSLKAQLCVAGRKALYAYCADHGVAHQRCGKLIVATEAAEEPALDAILHKAEVNGVDGEDSLVAISGADAMAMEPALRCSRALLSPSTGIVDSHALMLSYLGEAEAQGAMLALNAPVLGGAVTADGITLTVGGEGAMQITARHVVIAAGLASQSVARSLEHYPADHVPGQYYCKGNYFVMPGRAPFHTLIYPVPVTSGLGVHVTLDLAGNMRFGPDTQWLDGIDAPDVYTVDPTRADDFYAAIRRYYPDLPDGALIPGYSGIRPKLNPKGAVGDDFMIVGPAQHGVTGLVCLFGIESPGLTSSLAIGGVVANLLQ